MKRVITVSIDQNILDLLEYTNIGRKLKLNRSQIFERAVREYMATNWREKANYKREKEKEKWTLKKKGWLCDSQPKYLNS